MSRARGWVVITLLWAVGADASEHSRFSVRGADATVVDRSADARFAIHASVEIRKRPANPPRFALKSTTATCAPLPDALFQNGFE